MDKPKILSVSQMNRYIRKLLENDLVLQSLCVKGELSNVKRHSSGHIYFTLKDATAAVNCVMFKQSAQSLRFQMENGMSVLVFGYLSLYEKTGQYQLYAEYVDPAGIGALALQFEALKQKLSSEGLFALERKKPICRFAAHILVITSPTGAAVRDIIQIARRRNPAVKMTVLPVTVQGEHAAPEIVKALSLANTIEADTIILGRGGGSIEDLWAFNEETVARAVARSKIPVISAVGHETDYTITDFVSDLRAPTPSAAAELAVFDQAKMREELSYYEARLEEACESRILACDARLSALLERPVMKRPFFFLEKHQGYVDQLDQALSHAMAHAYSQREGRFLHTVDKMGILSPFAVLKRGYAVLYTKEGMPVREAFALKAGERISVRVHKGTVYAVVEQTEENNGKEEKKL